MLHERGEGERCDRLSKRAARDVERHRQPALMSRVLVHQRRGRRMKRRAAQAAENEHQREQHRIRRQADQRDRRDAQDRTGDEQHARPPSVGEVAERRAARPSWPAESTSAACRRRTSERFEVGDEQRQQRREDVAVAVDDEVRARQQQDGAVEPERSPRTAGSRREPAGSCVIAAIVEGGGSPSRRRSELTDPQQPRARPRAPVTRDSDRRAKTCRLCQADR